MDTEIGCFIQPEVGHAATEVQSRVQGRGVQACQGTRGIGSAGSEWCSNSLGLPRRQTSIISASATNWAVMLALIDQPTTRRENRIEVYFCEPQSPLQRGTNDNTNELLRQYFPKGTDLSIYSVEEISAVGAALNARPRKTLGWKTLAEALDALLL